MLSGAIEKVTEADLLALVSARAIESSTLDFKRELPGSSGKDKYEFAKDVCALANAGGGDLVYGIDEEDGGAGRIVPITGEAFDAAKRRLGMIADSGIEPRVVGLRMEAVKVDGGYVFLVRVPASFNGPHRIVLDSHSRFVIRNNTHTTELSYEQLRDAFSRMSTLTDKAQRFADNRIEDIQRGDTWKPMYPGPVAAVTFVPLMSMARRAAFDVGTIDYLTLRHDDWGGGTSVRNIDGVMAYLTVKQKPEDGLLAYTQLYRSGIIEGVRTARLTISEEKRMPSTVIAKFYRDAYLKYTAVAKNLGLTGPALFSCSLVNIDDYLFGAGDAFMGRSLIYSDRPHLLLPDGWIESLDAPLPVDDVVKPILDVLWEAFNCKRCLDYDNEGNWKPR